MQRIHGLERMTNIHFSDINFIRIFFLYARFFSLLGAQKFGGGGSGGGVGWGGVSGPSCPSCPSVM